MARHTEEHKKVLLAWLNDAYSMEKGLIPVLENHAKDAKNHPQVQSRIQQHVEQTKRHADLVQGRIEALGGDVSSVKAGVGSLIGNLQSMTTGAFQDELVKNALSDFASEHFEIASYNALIAAAQEVGDQETARVCQEILRDEQAMADWLDQNLPMVVRETMRQKASEMK